MPTYSTGYATQAIADDATFRIRGKWYSDRLTDIGWAKTAATGQIDWATVSKPGAANTVAGYEIRKSNDGKTDIYVKIEYGSGSAATNLGFWITAGVGSDGAATITGNKSDRHVAGMSGGSAISNTDYISGDTSRFMFAHAISGALATIAPIVVLQRTTDASLVDDSNGFMVFCLGPSTSVYKHQHVSFSGGATVARSQWGGSLSATGAVPGNSSNIPVWPLFVFTPNQYQMVRDAVMVPTAYAAMASTHTFSLGGSNRTWIALWGNSTGFIIEAVAAPVAMTLCLRWE